MSLFQIPSPIHEIQSDFISRMGVQVFVKRDDLIHEEVSGNKWRKLKHNVKLVQEKGYSRMVTFGGAYSNHIAATAAAGKLFQIETVGVIRGDEGFENATLTRAKENGMQLHFVSRSSYAKKTTAPFLEELKNQFGSFYLIPEGGANELGVLGCEEILQEQKEQFDAICCAAGTGTTAAGICRSLAGEQLLVFPVLKGGSFLLEEMKRFCTEEQLRKVSLQLSYHFGGYAKVKPEQLEFMDQFYSTYGIALDKIYTSKLVFGVFDLLKQGYFSKGSRILIIHTGGLQGN